MIMKYLRRWFPRTFAPVIMTDWGPVTERMRVQAALNMKADPNIKARVEALIVKESGGDLKKGIRESKRRFPEAYE